MESAQLRPIEEAKIECARRHFEAISNHEIKYSVVTNYEELVSAITDHDIENLTLQDNYPLAVR